MAHRYLNKVVTMDLTELIGPDDTPIHGEYAVQCPLCMQELKEFGKKLYIREDLESGYCQRCGSKFFPKEADPTSPNYKFLYRATIDNNKFTTERINCSYYFNAEEDSEDGVDYLISRDPWYGEHYKELGFRFYDDRVVIPFYLDGEVFFYQSRFIDTNKSKLRYHIPASTNKPIYICPISNLRSTKVILCEGVFGAIAISRRYSDYLVIAVLGSHVTRYQKYLLNKFCITEIILYFDQMDINYGVRSELQESYSAIPIKMIESPLGDPEDDLKAGRTLSIQTITKQNFGEELLSYLNQIEV